MLAWYGSSLWHPAIFDNVFFRSGRIPLTAIDDRIKDAEVILRLAFIGIDQLAMGTTAISVNAPAATIFEDRIAAIGVILY